MKDELAITNSIRALSPRVIAVHDPTITEKCTVFPPTWTYTSPRVKSGLTDGAQPTVLERIEE